MTVFVIYAISNNKKYFFLPWIGWNLFDHLWSLYFYGNYLRILCSEWRFGISIHRFPTRSLHGGVTLLKFYFQYKGFGFVNKSLIWVIFIFTFIKVLYVVCILHVFNGRLTYLVVCIIYIVIAIVDLLGVVRPGKWSPHNVLPLPSSVDGICILNFCL